MGTILIAADDFHLFLHFSYQIRFKIKWTTCDCASYIVPFIKTWPCLVATCKFLKIQTAIVPECEIPQSRSILLVTEGGKGKIYKI